MSDTEMKYENGGEMASMGMLVAVKASSGDFEAVRLNLARLIKYASEADELEIEHAVGHLLELNGLEPDRDPFELTEEERNRKAERRGYKPGDTVEVDDLKADGTKIQFEDGNRMRVDGIHKESGVYKLGQNNVPGLPYGRSFAHRKAGTEVTILEEHADLEKRETDYEPEPVPEDACSRCGGKGKLDAYRHVNGGLCFRCGGSGKDPDHTD